VQSGKYRKLYRGQPIFEVGYPCTTFYVVLSGLVGCHTSDNLPQVLDGHKGRRYAHLSSDPSSFQEAPGEPEAGSSLVLHDRESMAGSTCSNSCSGELSMPSLLHCLCCVHCNLLLGLDMIRTATIASDVLSNPSIVNSELEFYNL
jgi:hypothetical protein